MLSTIEHVCVKRRSKGERTKNLILGSAIAMLAEQGIKGTTHRAIASHADIQLSLTTYYFKDIQALVQQAFELNYYHATKIIEQLWQPILSLIAQQTKVALNKVSLRVALREELTDLLLNLIALNTDNNRQQLIVEQHLFNEALVAPTLRLIAENQYHAQLKPCLQLCQYFSKDKDKVEANAQILHTIVTQIQYQQLLANIPTVNSSNTRSMLYQTLALILDVKP